MEDLTFGEQVKIILGRKGMTIKELAETIEKETGKKMSRQNLTQRLGRDNFQEQDMRMIAQILGCQFHLSIMVAEGESEETQGETVVRYEQKPKAHKKHISDEGVPEQLELDLFFDKDPDEAELSLAFYLPYLPDESWPENLTIYVPDAYKDKFAAAWKKWKVKGETYTVSFNGDGAPGYMESVEGISGDYVLPESGFSYQSAILDYWALDNPEGDKAGCPGETFPVTENVVFYASWRLVIVIPEPENPVVCIHAWGEWQSDADKHWKKCSKHNTDRSKVKLTSIDGCISGSV